MTGTTPNEKWGSRIGLILATAGNAVGLGNFLRFPAQAVENGGGAFLIPYLVSLFVMGIPLVWVEWAIGRNGGKYGHHSTPGMLDVLGKSSFYKYFGVFGIFTNLAIIAYYCYIESWTLSYMFYSIVGTFSDMNPTQIAAYFNEYLGVGQGTFFNISPIAILFFAITILLNFWILSKGLAKGIELAGKILMPALVIFGIFLAIRAITLQAGDMGAINDSIIGLNFLWEPQFDSLSNPKVWLAAAGQVFFTLSVGMGSIHCFASYLSQRDDVALNGSTSGFVNEFVEIILGGSIIIPIAVAYMGLPWLQENVGFAMGFKTMPSLFQNWGPFFAAIGGMFWFGLLFFAGITSSLAMGQTVMAFLKDEFRISQMKSILIVAVTTVVLAIPSIILYEKGAFDEYDFWAGTFALVLFALGESILFAWVFGIDKAWAEINKGADIKIPTIFKFVIKYITPVFILAVFLGALFKPASGDWLGTLGSFFSGNGWQFAGDSVIGYIFHVGTTDPDVILVTNLVRLLLALVFIGICVLVYISWRRKKNEKLSEGVNS